MDSVNRFIVWTVEAAALLLIMLAGYLPAAAGTLVVMLLAVLFGYGWPRLLAVPAQKTLGTVLAATGVLAELATLLSRESSVLVWAAPIAAAGCIVVFVVQLLRGTGQSHRLESTLGCVGAVAATVSASGWLAAVRYTQQPGFLEIIAVSALVVVLVSMLPLPDAIVAPFGLSLGTLAAPLVALLLSEVHVLAAAVTGLLVSALFLAFRRLGSVSAPAGGWLSAISLGLAPVFSVGALVYLAEKMLLA